MSTLPRRIITIGAGDGDDEDMRLRKVLLLIAALVVTALAVVWGAIYFLAGAPTAALVPWLYVAISLGSLTIFAVTRRYDWFAISQFVPFVTLPFVLMWILGGFAQGSAVAIWAGLGPIIALLLGHRRLAFLLAAEYALLMLGSAVLPTPSPPTLPGGLESLFFVLNLAAVPLVAWLLVRLFASGREGALTAVRETVRRYFSPELAAALLEDPHRAELGGEIMVVTVLFADLGSFSTFAEARSPTEVVGLLNRYFAVAIPAILEQGGLPTQLAGDAVMAVFGAPTAQADHARRACRAAQAIIERTDPLAAGAPAGPRFHIGVNSGHALVGNIGSEDYRNFTAIGDTTNVAARLQGIAQPGEVVIGPETARLLGDDFALASLGSVSVKGRVQAVEAYALRRA
jgi:class 3 adenylate cyclase